MVMKMVGEPTKIPPSRAVAVAPAPEVPDTRDEEFSELQGILHQAYEGSVTIEDAERYAALFLETQMKIATRLQRADLDARMRKSGVKATRAKVFQAECAKSDKKPSDSVLEAAIEVSEEVRTEQQNYDNADSTREMLQTYLGIFREAHIYFRGISKGRYE